MLKTRHYAIAVAIAAVVLICSAGIWREFHH